MINDTVMNILDNGHNYSKMTWGNRQEQLFETIWSKIGVVDEQIAQLLCQNISEEDIRIQNLISHKKALRNIMNKMKENNKELKNWVNTNLLLINDH